MVGSTRAPDGAVDTRLETSMSDEQQEERKRIQLEMPWALYERGAVCAIGERKSFSAWVRSAMEARVAATEGGSAEGMAAAEMVNAMEPGVRALALDVLEVIAGRSTNSKPSTM